MRIPAPDGKGGFVVEEKDRDFAEKMIGNEELGAIKNGKRVRKIKSEPADRTPDGMLGTVHGSVYGGIPAPGGKEKINYGYLVVWDDCPDQYVFVVGIKVKEVE